MKGLRLRLFGLFQMICGVIIFGYTFVSIAAFVSLDKQYVALAMLIVAPLITMGGFVAVIGMLECLNGYQQLANHERLGYLRFIVLMGFVMGVTAALAVLFIPPMDISSLPDNYAGFHINW